MTKPLESQAETDDEDGEVIWHEPTLTRYDKALNKRRAAQAKMDALLALPVRSESEERMRLVLAHQIEAANKAMKRAESDLSRRQESISEHRAGAGREKYNAERRNRPHPNDDLSGLSDAEKKQRKMDQRADANWFKRCRDKGMTEPMIVAAYQVRLEERRRVRQAESAAKTQNEAEEAAMRSLPGYDLFGSSS